MTVTGLPSQHLSADWLAVAARAASPLLCVAVTFKFVCEIQEMIQVQHDISKIVAVQRIPPVIHTSDSEH